jgi:Family of unknown function (DUF6166)
MRIYSGREDGVVVREAGSLRLLSGQAYPDHDGQNHVLSGDQSPTGRKLALALLTDALEDSERASDLADRFTRRVISILPERWTMTQARIISYVELIDRQLLEERFLKSSAPFRTSNSI